MYICQVIGKVLSTVKNEKMAGAGIVMVRTVSLSASGEAVLGGDVMAAADPIGCGEGNYVLVTCGAGARLACRDQTAPVDMAVVGILDGGFGKTL